MVTSLWLVIITLLLIWSQSNAQEYFLQPERDARFVSSGDSDSTVIQPGDSLYDSLRTLQSDSSLVLSSGQYQLEQYILVSNLSKVRISGQENVIISCRENVGLAFINMTGLVIESVRIEGCGLSGRNLNHALAEIRQFIDLFLVVYSEIRAALLLAHCENLQMNKVELYNNVGFGVVGVNIIGTSVISQLTAINNMQPSDCRIFGTTIDANFQDPDRYGGGAVFIYHDYLIESYNNQLHQLTMKKGMFKNNTDCNFNVNNYFDISETEYFRNLGYRIGGGGGLTLMMAQLKFGIQITTKDTMFLQNRAFIGSGAHVAIFSGAKNTALEFINCNFSSNGGPLEVELLQTIGGAGLGVVTDFGGPLIEQKRSSNVANILNTSIRIENSNFLENISPNGAGIFYYSLYKSDVKDTVYVSIQNSIFHKNVAYAGSAIFASELKYNAAYLGTQLEVIDTNITANTIVSTNSSGASSSSVLRQDTGIIDLLSLNMTLKGSCFINKNLGTGLKAELSYVGINGNITFSKNTALRGGAMYLTTYTWLIVLPNASLYLLDNTAREAGGAIYSFFPGATSINTGSSIYPDCFLTFNYNDIGPCINCSDLNKTGSFIKFEGNSAPAGGQVFGSSFLSCYWVLDIIPSLNNIDFNSILYSIVKGFPTVFSFDTSTIRPEYFQTQAQTLHVFGPNNTAPDFNVFPGQVFHITFFAHDGFGQIVSTVISSFAITESLEFIPNATPRIEQNNFGLLKDGRSTELSMSVTGKEGQNFSVVIYSTDAIGAARASININLGHCVLGYVFDNISLSCVCRPELNRLGVTCDDQSLELRKNSGQLVDWTSGQCVGSCRLPIRILQCFSRQYNSN